MNNKPLQAHLSMFAAEAMWGLMSPVGKDAMNHGIDGLSMVSFRMMGAALLFWVASQFAKREHVPMRDVLLFGGAALLGVVLLQRVQKRAMARYLTRITLRNLPMS